MWSLNSLLTISTIKEVEYNTRTRPATFYSFHDTVDVKDVSTANLYARSLVVTLGVTNCAIIISIFTTGRQFVFTDTLGIHARKALLLSAESAASMTTRKYLVAVLIYQIYACLWTANVGKSWQRWLWRMSQLSLTESTLLCSLELFVLLTSLEFMVRFFKTVWVWAEIFRTLIAPNSVFCHTFCWVAIDLFSVCIFLVHVNSPLNNLHHISTVTFHQIGIILKELSQHKFFKLSFLFLI